MKNKPIGSKALYLMVVCLLLPTVALADYARMNKDLNTYSPPHFFTHFVTHKPGEPETRNPQTSTPIKSQIQALKKSQKMRLDSRDIPFLADLDPTLYAKLINLSSNLATRSFAISTLVGKKVVLKEIEIIAALINPGILAAQKQVAAEFLSYDQIMGLDDTLKRYDGFTKGLNNKAGPSSMKSSIKQGWPFPGLTGVKGKIIREQVAIAVEKKISSRGR